MPAYGIGVAPSQPMMNAKTKADVLGRLKRIGGQVEGIQRMIEEERYCVEVLHQLSAAQAALGQAAKRVLTSHVDTCVSAAMKSGTKEDRARKIGELMDVFERFGCLKS